MAGRIGAFRTASRLCLHISEAEIASGLKSKFKLSDADIKANSALIASCCKSYTKPIPGPHAEDMSEEQLRRAIPKLEAFYRPNVVLARSAPYVMPQAQKTFSQFASEELFSPHFKYFMVGWGVSLSIVAIIGMNISPQIADGSAFMNSIKMRDHVLLKEDRERLQKMGKLD